jgi:hypothetical protein
MKKAFFTLCTLVLCLLAFTEAQAQNSIDNAEFFVRQQFRDFLGTSYTPTNSEVFSRVSQINSCSGNATCIHNKRVEISRAFWDDSRFRAQSRTFGLGLTSGYELYDNYDFVELSYLVYLQRASNAPPDDYQRLGFYFWKEQNLDPCVANSGGDFGAASWCYDHIVDAFLSSTEYRARFGTP